MPTFILASEARQRYRDRGVPGSLVGVVYPSVNGRNAVATPPTHPALLTNQLTKRFGATTALDRLDLEITAGQVFGFLGPNGAGKSTTIRLLLGLLRPTSGSAFIFGVDAADATAHRRLAYVPADVALWPQLTGAQTLELLTRVGPGADRPFLADLVRRFDLDVSQRCGAYSTGNRQKVALVAAFATRASLLILDEPTSGLDPLMEQQFRRCLREATERGQTVFLSSHHLAEVEAVCDQVGILRAGRLVEVASIGNLRALRRTELLLRYTDGQPPPLAQLQAIPTVVAVRAVAHDTVGVTLAGSPAAVLQVLAATPPATMQIREPSLEEIFLEYYGEPAA